MRKLFFAVALALVSLASTAQTSMKINMDPSVKPGDDFWQYAVGGWLKANPLDAQHPMPWEQLLNDFKGIDYVAYRDALGLPKDIEVVNVGEFDAIHEVEKVLAETSVEDLKSYMELHVINAYASFLSDAFTDRAFEASKVISGVQEQQPRWKRAVSTISGSLGETIGKLYVKEFFPEARSKYRGSGAGAKQKARM